MLTVPLETAFLAVINCHHQGALVAAAKYLLTCLLSLLSGFQADRTARLNFLARTSHGSKPAGALHKSTQKLMAAPALLSSGAGSSKAAGRLRRD
jgi:hypothetical protein